MKLILERKDLKDSHRNLPIDEIKFGHLRSEVTEIFLTELIQKVDVVWFEGDIMERCKSNDDVRETRLLKAKDSILYIDYN